MKYLLNTLTLSSIMLLSCQAQTEKFTILGKIDKNRKEVSAVETVSNSSLIWVIEDAGNNTNIVGLNGNGETQKEVTVTNAKNKDWEDLTSDDKGNLYIGDFGNNSRKRDNFSIYKVANIAEAEETITATEIKFTLPKGVKSKDMEAFFLHNNNFYIFSKERKKAYVLKVPNIVGEHEATLVTDFNLKGKKNNEVTSADISSDGKTIILLNHDRVWTLTDFNGEDFFGGTVTGVDFNHDSKKEGICFKSSDVLYITDESNKGDGGKLYSFRL